MHYLLIKFKSVCKVKLVKHVVKVTITLQQS
jgi:hypothetical protein